MLPDISASCHIMASGQWSQNKSKKSILGPKQVQYNIFIVHHNLQFTLCKPKACRFVLFTSEAHWFKPVKVAAAFKFLHGTPLLPLLCWFLQSLFLKRALQTLIYMTSLCLLPKVYQISEYGGIFLPVLRCYHTQSTLRY